MNPQYGPPGQSPYQHNNNLPLNQYPPSSEFNGVPNANYSSFTNGPSSHSSDVTQKFQSLHLSQSQLQSGSMPEGQLPPGANFPPNFVQGGLGSNQNRSLASGAPVPQGQLPPTSQGFLPPTSMPQRPPGSGASPQLAGYPSTSTPGQQSNSASNHGQLPPQNQFPLQSMQPQHQLPTQKPQPPIARPASIPPQDSTHQAVDKPGPPQPDRDQEGSLQSKPFLPPSQGPPSMNYNQQFQAQKPPTSQAFSGAQSGHISPFPEQFSSQQSQGLLNIERSGQNTPQPVQKPPQFDHGQTESGQPPLPKGTFPPQQSHRPPQPGQIPSLPGQLQSKPGVPQSQPGQLPLERDQSPAQMPPQMGQSPPQLGQLPPQTGQTPPQLSKFPPRQSQMSTQPGQMPQQSGPFPPQTMQPMQPSPLSGHFPPQLSHIPKQPGQLPTQSGQMPSQQNLPPPQQAQLPPQQAQLPHQQSQMPPSGLRLQQPPQSGPMPPLPGMFPQKSGQLPPQSGPSPMQPGQMPPQLNQFPSQPGQFPLPSGQQQLPTSTFNRPGQPPMQPGFSQPEMPPTPQQFPGQFNQQPSTTMPGLPYMPPPIGQTNQYPPGSQVGFQQPSFGGQPPQRQQYPGMPPMPGQQQLPNQQPYPTQAPYPGQQPYPGHQQSPPGAQPFPGQQPSYPAGYQQPQQAVKRLDPDQMPSPVQVMSDDQANRSGLFVTNEKGAVPPLVTTDFIVDDQGNSSPRFIRSSMYSVPVTADLLKQTAVPFCLAISPMAETVGAEREPPLLDFAALTNSPAMGPVRCTRCKAYMCPAMKFVDASRHFKCAFCKASTEVPMEYTQYVNSMQQYGRIPAEMGLGTYEIVATKEYCRNNTMPNPPALVFLIDVSYNAVKCGLVDLVCRHIKDIVGSIPCDADGTCPTRVGFITYCSTLHFYNIKGTLGQPQMLSVGDVADVFVPLLEGFLVKAEDAGLVLDSLLEQIPHLFADNKETEIILLPAIQAGLEALKAAETSGQLIVFHTSLPTLNAPGKLANREDRKLLGTEKEKQVLNPQTTAYNELGQALSAAGVSCELFIMNNSYVDLATIGQLARLTGGGIHKYTYFTAEADGHRLIEDVRRVVSRPTGFDAVMRVRTSTGVRATDFHGHFFMSNTTDVELAAIDADKSIAVEIKHDDKLTGEDGVYVQAALLYTHRSGQRRLRVLNLALGVAQQLADVYRSCELDTVVNYLSKQGVMALRENSPRTIREGLSQRCARSLATYRKHCASPSAAGQLVLPESMKLMPLYVCCMLRSDALAGGPDMTCDDRSAAMYRALTADVATSLVTHYPRLLPLHRVLDSRDAPLPLLRASMDKMQPTGVYLLENGVHMLLWIGSQASPEFIQDVFGVQSSALVDPQVTELPVLETEASEAVRSVISDARRLRRLCMRLTVMRQHDKLEAVLRHFLVEDRGVDASVSYVDFLCHVHKEIRALL